MEARSDQVQMRLAFKANKNILKIISNFYTSDVKKHKRSILIHGNDDGVTFITHGEKTRQISLFMPHNMFIDFYVCESHNEYPVGVCVNFGLLIDFLQLSIARGSRIIELISWNNLDFINLRCLENENDQCLELSMEIPTLTFIAEESLEELAGEGIEAKANLAGSLLDSVCALIEHSFENVIIEFDPESYSIKFIAESDNHLLDLVMTEDLADCAIEITMNSSYSFSASLFRQLHTFLPSTLKSSLRIHNGGLLVVKLIIKIDEVNLFLTLVFANRQKCRCRITWVRKMQIKEPSEFLKNAIGRNVRVKLNSGFSYKGILNCLDGFMNIAMGNCEESFGDRAIHTYKSIFIRGNNVLYITLI